MANPRLKELEELAATLTGVVMNEADPRHWPGGLTPVQELSREEQSARVICKKSAALSASLLQKVTDLLNATVNPTSANARAAAKADDEAALAEQIRQANEEVARIFADLARDYPSH
ncbi:hypothetical protein NLN85_01200 [Citrobacter portucalensis]|uniref:hypothetical protein n=1 Tax=Citrobacter portucalensis TaxID=1639133 RepID=UPI00226B0387|nr:hypothetical protein [Citrobacter portucalensis]MCX8991126.1 hypothetical protein [Citrobacter portucalensis]